MSLSRSLLASLLLLFGLLGVAAAQQAAEPPAKPSAPAPEAVQEPPAEQPAPDDFTGMYQFVDDGEFLQVNLEEDGRVTGFVSRYMDDHKDSFVDHFFKEGSYKQGELRFTTKRVHGIWFDFTGTVEKDSDKQPGEEGYRVLKGKLTRHQTDMAGNDFPKTRDVKFESFPADLDPGIGR